MPPNYEYATLQTNRADDIRIYSTHHIKDISRNYGSRFVKSVERGRERKKNGAEEVLVDCVFISALWTNKHSNSLCHRFLHTQPTNQQPPWGDKHVECIGYCLYYFIDWRTSLKKTTFVHLFVRKNYDHPLSLKLLRAVLTWNAEILFHVDVYMLYHHSRILLILQQVFHQKHLWNLMGRFYDVMCNMPTKYIKGLISSLI